MGVVPPPDPEQTVARAAEWQVANFDALYKEHFAFVWRSLRQLGVPSAALDDAAQNVFLVVHRRFAEFENRASVRTWLFRIALRVASDSRRSIRRRGPSEPVLESIPDGNPDPLGVAVRGEAMNLLERLIDRMAEEKRAVFILADLEQLSVPQIADMLGLNANTVGSRLRAARREFEAAIERHQRRTR